MRARAIVFDLDGTLVRFDIDTATLKREVITVLSKLGIPPSLFSINDSLTDLLDKVEAYIDAHGMGDEARRRIWNEVFRAMRRFEESAISTASLMPGAYEVLSSLRERGFKIGLITLNSAAVVSNVLERLGIKKFFDAMISRDDVKNVKPNPEHLLEVLRRLEVRPEEAVVVGDTVFDMRCAKKVGAMAIGITTGRSSEEELRKAGADCVVESLSELLFLLSQLDH